ncbi:MAG: bifunctional 5,10-methylenetetrahydrofolate dehydrogenase/5,10-methenyltetrahydrofolate cyclohydrolase [Patescibacteria group bacterium]|jgi:methylenetetrahydrofolate dehydrogenase (NADP+)/methenyltetrahydrofolate cyclohydrolase
MVEKIAGKKIAERVKDEIALNIYKLKGDRPSLAVILVGDREDSQLYVGIKEREAVKVGIDTHLYRLAQTTTEAELIEIIEFLNQDDKVDGILIQLPLPDHLDTDKIISKLNPEKDVDGFHPHCPNYLSSPVVQAVKASLAEINLDCFNKTACLFCNSEAFGRTMKTSLIKQGLTIVPEDQSEKADILISALGVPESVTGKVIKAGAVLIDIGTTKVEGVVKGDINFESVKDKAAYLTPVPGGIGPMTIAFLFKNVWEIFKRKNKLS